MPLLLYNGDESDPNFFYHTKLDIDNSFLLVEGKKRILFVSSMNQRLAKSSFRGKVVVYKDAIADLAPYIRGKTVQVDARSISASLEMRLRKQCRIKDHSVELDSLRRKKKPEEVACIRRAVRYTKDIIESLDLRGNKTELDIKRQLLVKTFDLGLTPAFEPIVSTDANTAYPHYHSGRKRIGSLVMVDYGVRYNHYCSDITRCFILDGDRKKKEQYERLKDICYFITDSLPDLEKGKDVAKLAGELIKTAGFPKMIHSIGHGVGLEVHDPPHLNIKSEDPVEGAVLAIEPAFYLARYGMRYEETVYNDGKTAKVL